MKNAKYIRSGKAKDIYQSDGDIVFVFTDRVTAFDGKKKHPLRTKGKFAVNYPVSGLSSCKQRE